jgi:hypothetical protein
MFAEVVYRGMTPAKWRGTASIFRKRAEQQHIWNLEQSSRLEPSDETL